MMTQPARAKEHHALRMVLLGRDADRMYWPDHKRPFIYYWRRHAMTRKSAIRHATPANRGVFCDLGFDEAEAKVLEMRAELMAALREHIKERGWTQSKAAEELGITQPRVSALVKGVWRDWSCPGFMDTPRM